MFKPIVFLESFILFFEGSVNYGFSTDVYANSFSIVVVWKVNSHDDIFYSCKFSTRLKQWSSTLQYSDVQGHIHSSSVHIAGKLYFIGFCARLHIPHNFFILCFDMLDNQALVNFVDVPHNGFPYNLFVMGSKIGIVCRNNDLGGSWGFTVWVRDNDFSIKSNWSLYKLLKQVPSSFLNIGFVDDILVCTSSHRLRGDSHCDILYCNDDYKSTFCVMFNNTPAHYRVDHIREFVLSLNMF